MAGGDDDTARKLQRLQDYNPGHDQTQQHPPPPPPQQHLPPVQRTHAGFQHAMSPPGADHSQHQGQGPHTPVHHHLPPMVDPQLGGGAGGHQLAPIQTPGPPPHMQPFPQTPDNGQDSADRNKGRQLSNTKRAAQNRAAQRAFRQRKEVHIKNLETKVNELDPLKRQVHSLQQDNYALRGYLITMLEMCATKGYEIPPGMPSMQNLQSGPPPPPPLDSPSQDDQQHEGDPASAQLHAQQQAQYEGHDEEMGDAPHRDENAPTAPMQNIAQQAMDHGGEHRRPGPGQNNHYGPPPGAHTDASKIDPAVTGV